MRSEYEIRNTIALLEAYIKRDMEKIDAYLSVEEFTSLKISILSNGAAAINLRWALEDSEEKK